MSAPDPSARLLAKIERFLSSTGMSAAAFGKLVMKDPRFVYQLRKGRELRRKTIERVTEDFEKARAAARENAA